MNYVYAFGAGLLVGFYGRGRIQKSAVGKVLGLNDERSIQDRVMDHIFGNKNKKKGGK